MVSVDHQPAATVDGGPLTGGCACGAVRYRVAAGPRDVAYCHCRLCQKTSGAPTLAWASVPIESFAYTEGAPRVYRSSDWGERRFCGECGTQLEFRRSRGARSVDITLASLDDPEALRPAYHVWTASRISWFDTADDLPRHPDEPAGALE